MRSYFRLLIPYFKKQPLFISIIFIVLIIQASIIISFQISYKEIFDGVSNHKALSFLVTWIAIILIAAILRILVGMLCDYLVGKATLTIFNHIRIRLFHHLQWLPASFYQRMPIGELVSRYSSDVQNSERVTRQNLPQVIRSLLLGIISVVILFYFDWRLTLLAFCLFPFVVVGVFLFMKKAREATRRNQIANNRLASMIEEIATQHLLLQAFNLQKSFKERFKTLLKEYQNEFLSGIFLRTLVARTSVFGLSISEIFIFSMGALMVHQGLMSIGTLFGFFALIWNISSAISTVSDIFPNLIEAGGQMTQLEEFLAEKIDEPLIEDQNVKKPPSPSLRQGISLRNVSLCHDSHAILKNLSFEIPAGSSLALVGSTGSGKTSILSLLMGFYSPSEGELFLDGKDIKAIDRESLRSHIGIVFQHNPLFNLSIRENIRIGRLDATDQEIEEAAKAAEIHDFISSLPKRYDTLIREYGTNLSGGQRQRIALARVYLRNPSLLLLDEPTSALDPIVESHINQTIAKLSKGRTVVLSTHRLATLTHVDHILVLDHGKIIESGNHAELLQKEGHYFHLWQKQHAIALNKEGKSYTIQGSYLRTLPLLKDVDETLLNEITDHFVIERAEEGKVIFEKGSYGNKFYLIARGTVNIYDSEKPEPYTLCATLEEGDYFGEVALLRSSPRMAQAVTSSHCIFLTLQKEQFIAILSKVPSLLKILEERISQFT